MSVLNAMGSAIFGKLSAGTALTTLLPGSASIYRIQAPMANGTIATSFPFVIFSVNSGGPRNETPSDRRDEVVWIRAYSKLGPGQAGSIDAAISGLLHNQPVTVTGYTTMHVQRELDAEFVDNLPNTEPVWMCGGMYRFMLDA